jgi:hypothetical protein
VTAIVDSTRGISTPADAPWAILATTSAVGPGASPQATEVSVNAPRPSA